MRVLAFDPGHTTGIAFIDNGAVEMVTTVEHNYITYHYTFLLCDAFSPDLVVVEAAPTGRLADALTLALIANLTTYVAQAGVKLVRITPGLWKPVSPKPDKSWAIHGADAVGLALYAERVHKA